MLNQKDRYSKLVSNSLVLAIGNFITKIMAFVLMPLYTTYMTTEQYGMADIINTTVELLMPIFTLSISEGVFRFCLDEDNSKNEILKKAIKITLLGFIVLLILSPIAVIFIEVNLVILFFVLYITTAIKTVLSQFCRGIGDIKGFTISGIIGAIVLLILNLILLVQYKLGVEAYVLAICGSNIIVSIYLFLKCDIKQFIHDNETKKTHLQKQLIKYSIFLMPNSIAWWLTNISSRYILMAYEGTGTSGIYAAASKIPTIINILSNIFQQAWQSSSTEQFKNSDRDEFYTNIFKVFSIFVIIVASITIMLTPYISKILLSNEFYEGWKITPLLIVSAVMCAFSYYFGTFYVAAKESKWVMISTMIGAITNVIICIMIIPILGMIGAAVASILSYAIITIIRIINTRKKVVINVNWVKLIANLILLVIQSAIWILDFEIGKFVNALILLSLTLINIKEIIELSRKVLHKLLRNTSN